MLEPVTVSQPLKFADVSFSLTTFWIVPDAWKMGAYQPNLPRKIWATWPNLDTREAHPYLEEIEIGNRNSS